MLKNSKRLIVIVIATIVLPLVMYLVYEVSSLQEDEQVIQRIYENQLEFVIFSANQYSNDFLDRLVSSLEEDLESATSYPISAKSQTLLTTSGCMMVNLKPVDSTGIIGPGKTHPDALPDAYTQMIDTLHKGNEAIIGQLVNYRKLGDYRKLEPNQMIYVDSLEMQVLYAVLLAPDGGMVLMTGIIEPSAFANEVLSPKLQQIAQQDLVISLTHTEKNTVMLQTDTLSSEVIAAGKMWLFPGTGHKSEEPNFEGPDQSKAAIQPDRFRDPDHAPADRVCPDWQKHLSANAAGTDQVGLCIECESRITYSPGPDQHVCRNLVATAGEK